jgi:hypothetical protein
MVLFADLFDYLTGCLDGEPSLLDHTKLHRIEPSPGIQVMLPEIKGSQTHGRTDQGTVGI